MATINKTRLKIENIGPVLAFDTKTHWLES